MATAPEALPTVPEIEVVSDVNAASYDAVVFVTTDATAKADVAEPIASAVPRLAGVSSLFHHALLDAPHLTRANCRSTRPLWAEPTCTLWKELQALA